MEFSFSIQCGIVDALGKHFPSCDEYGRTKHPYTDGTCIWLPISDKIRKDWKGVIDERGYAKVWWKEK
jgi:hypothetical protein